MKKSEVDIISEAIEAHARSEVLLIKEESDRVKVVYHKNQHIGTIHDKTLDPVIKQKLSPSKVDAQAKKRFWVLAYDHQGDHTDLGRFPDLRSAKSALAAHHKIKLGADTDVVSDRNLN